MLFSNDDVAKFINQRFEPVWEAVRPVPIVRIDFGSGRVLTRTLHGNIATYVCSSDGLTLDILPGIYEPKTYLDRLRQFAMLSWWAKSDETKRADVLKSFHDKQAKSLEVNGQPLRIVNMDFSKIRIEKAVKFVLLPAAKPTADTTPTDASDSDSDAARKLAGWKALAEDTRINETDRRRLIHAKLASDGLVPPGKITKWLYREVLHADLDDPYLGLGEVLFADYPFRDEDAR